MTLIVKWSFVLLTVWLFQRVVSENLTDSNNNIPFELPSDNEETRVLSRRKRFLTFPDGSSFQLVFCVQTAALIPIGDIFLYGNTAALAWNLPSDPSFLDFLRDKEKAQRRGDSVSINYLDENGRLIAKVPYRRKTIVNPAFAKRSVDEREPTSYKEKLKYKLDRERMHSDETRRDYLMKDGMEETSVEFHRSNRLELLEKIERLFTALGRDGRQCVLYKLCEAAQRSPTQGTFLQEFLRVVFTLPKGKEFEEEYHREYDKAHSVGEEDCGARYPGCEEFDMTDQL